MILRIDNLTKECGKNNSYQKILDNISLEFKSGEFICILGESGSGKSTLLNIIGGLDSKYEGSINLNNKNLKYIDIDEYRRENIGFIFQSFNLINSMSVIDNILVPIDKYNISYKQKNKRVNELLKKLNIYDIRNKKIVDLSGGQKQRIAIARALINNPTIILADEPTGALDEKNSESVLKILKEIQIEGKLVIVVTHSEKVKDYSTRVIRINDGKICSDKKIKRIKEKKVEKDIVNENNNYYLLKYGIRNFLNNKKRNFFIMLASAIGIIGIILSLFIGSSVKKYMENIIMDKSNPNLYNVRTINKDLSNNKLYSNKEINKIKKINHIKKVFEEKSYNLGKLEIDNKKYNLSFVDSINKIDLEKGNSNKLVISKFLAKKINKEYKKVIGKKVYLSLIDDYDVVNIETTISGIAKNSGISILDNNMHSYINYNYLKKIYSEKNMDLKPNSLSIEIDNLNNKNIVKSKLKNNKLSISNNNDLYKELRSYLDIATFILSTFSSLSLIVSVIMISIIINITVLERVKEIGLLRSIGYTKKDIKHIFNSEAFFLGFIIGVFSCVISKLFIKLIIRILKNKFNINIEINPNKFFVFGIFLSVLITVIASYFPSKKASNYDPINALKYE